MNEKEMFYRLYHALKRAGVTVNLLQKEKMLYSTTWWGIYSRERADVSILMQDDWSKDLSCLTHETVHVLQFFKGDWVRPLPILKSRKYTPYALNKWVSYFKETCQDGEEFMELEAMSLENRHDLVLGLVERNTEKMRKSHEAYQKRHFWQNNSLAEEYKELLEKVGGELSQEGSEFRVTIKGEELRVEFEDDEDYGPSVLVSRIEYNSTILSVRKDIVDVWECCKALGFASSVHLLAKPK